MKSKSHIELLEEYYNEFLIDDVCLQKDQVKFYYELGHKFVSANKYFTAVNTLYRLCADLCDTKSSMLQEREKLIHFAASLCFNLRDTPYMDAVGTFWTSLPEDLQDAIFEEEEKIEQNTITDCIQFVIFSIPNKDIPNSSNLLTTSYEGQSYLVHRLFYGGTTIELEIFNKEYSLTFKFPISSIKNKQYNDSNDLEYCEITGIPEYFEKVNTNLS